MYVAQPNQHVSFDRPEAWALKYFASTTMLSGLQPEYSTEGRKIGSVTVGFEMGWMPSLDSGQTRVGFNGTVLEDLNKAPVMMRPVVRVALPWQLTAVAAAPPPFEVFGVTPRILAFGLERPILKRDRWRVGWRGYGQVGWVKGAFTCSHSMLAFAPGTADNPLGCVGESSDKATLRYAGSELQVAYRIPGNPKLVPHAAVGANFIDGALQVNAPLDGGMDRNRLWTHGATFTSSAGASYLLSQKFAITIDAFYTPLWVRRADGAPRTNDGLFNVRALLSYTIN